jgi:ABC-type phosphate/phosphonate transport system substrate-binding protein
MKSVSDKNSLFFGVIFILLAGIVGSSGILWKNFIEFTQGTAGLSDVFSGVSQSAPFVADQSDKARDEIIFTFSVPRGDLVQFLEIVQPKLNEVAKRTGRPVKINLSRNETDIINKIERKMADFGSISAMTYIKNRNKRKIKAILQRYSTPPKRALILVNKNDSAQTILDLRNYRIAYKHNYSLPGYLVPISDLKKQGIDSSTYFKDEIFTENYSNSLLGLQNKEFDCAVISSNFFSEQPEKLRKKFKVVYETEVIPGGVYIVNKNRKLATESIIKSKLIEIGTKISKNEMFAGMFQTRAVNEKDYEQLEKEFAHDF